MSTLGRGGRGGGVDNDVQYNRGTDLYCTSILVIHVIMVVLVMTSIVDNGVQYNVRVTTRVCNSMQAPSKLV